MKKAGIFLLVAVLLTGCGAKPTFETLADGNTAVPAAPMQQVLLELPKEVSAPTMESGSEEKIYLCDGYSITVNTVAAGDLDKTLRHTTGFAKEDLQLLQTRYGDLRRYECVWAAAGEAEEQVGRLCLIDDGAYHYVLSVMADASQTARLRDAWNTLFDSFRLVSAETDVNTGS